MAGATAGVFAPDRRALTLGILLAVGAFAADGMGVVPALPVAVRELHGLPLFGWTFSAFMLACIVGTIGGGQLADARGPLWPMTIGLGGFGAGLVLAATAGSMAQLLAGRALQGLGGGAMVASAYVAIARGYPDQMRARMMALTASVWILPAVVGPALSGSIAVWISWRWVFLGILPLIGVVALLVVPPLRALAVRRPMSDATRLLASLRLAIGATLVLAVPSVHAPPSWPAIAWWLLPGVVGIAGVALLLPALRALLPRGTFLGRRGLPAGLAARGLLAFSYLGAEAFVPLGATTLRGATPARAGVALTVGALGWIAASWAQDRMESESGASGRAGRVGLGFLLCGAGVATVGAVLVTELPLWLGLVGWATGGAGIGLAYSAGALLCIGAAPPGQEGEVSGQLQVTESLGTATGAAVGGALLALLEQLGRSQREGYAAVFCLPLAAALLGLALTRRLPPSPPASGPATP